MSACPPQHCPAARTLSTRQAGMRPCSGAPEWPTTRPAGRRCPAAPCATPRTKGLPWSCEVSSPGWCGIPWRIHPGSGSFAAPKYGPLRRPLVSQPRLARHSAEPAHLALIAGYAIGYADWRACRGICCGMWWTVPRCALGARALLTRNSRPALTTLEWCDGSRAHRAYTFRIVSNPGKKIIKSK